MIIDKIILDNFPIFITKKICYYRHINKYISFQGYLNWIKKYPSVIEKMIESIYTPNISDYEKNILEDNSLLFYLEQQYQPSGGRFCNCGQYLGVSYTSLNTATYHHQVPRDCIRYINLEIALKILHL